MADQRAAVDFMYVEVDIPADMTITSWRAQRAQTRCSRRSWLQRLRDLLARRRVNDKDRSP
jgi:hypothetical protein